MKRHEYSPAIWVPHPLISSFLNQLYSHETTLHLSSTVNDHDVSIGNFFLSVKLAFVSENFNELHQLAHSNIQL